MTWYYCRWDADTVFFYHLSHDDDSNNYAPIVFIALLHHPYCQPRGRWVSIAFFVLEASAGFTMGIIVVLLLLYRRSELREVRIYIQPNQILSCIFSVFRPESTVRT